MVSKKGIIGIVIVVLLLSLGFYVLKKVDKVPDRGAVEVEVVDSGTESVSEIDDSIVSEEDDVELGELT